MPRLFNDGWGFQIGDAELLVWDQVCIIQAAPSFTKNEGLAAIFSTRAECLDFLRTAIEHLESL